MRFRVTSITGPEEGRRISSVTVPMEDRLNQDLAAVDFGSDLTLFVLLFVTAFDEPEKNELWARGQTKLGRTRKDEHGNAARIQSFGVPVTRSEMKYLTGADLEAYLTTAAASAFSHEPPKSAKGLAWQTLRKEVLVRLSSTVQSAA